MSEIFRPGMRFESGKTYVADRAEYVIELSDTRPRGRIIKEYEVPVAFELRDLQDVTIDLGGAVLMFHGRILPFVLENCKNVILRNFTITYRRAACTQGEILEADENHLAMRITEGFDCVFRDGEVILKDGGTPRDTHNGDMLLQPFDPVTRAPAYNAGCMLALVGEGGKEYDNLPLSLQRLRSEIREDGAVVWYGKFPPTYRAGQVLVFTHESRATPGIYVCDGENTVVEHVRMRHVAGFGIHNYFGRDFTVRDLVLEVPEGSSELISINADGIHMIGLSGKLLIEDCVLENMLDDGGNFHGYFTPVVEVDGNRAGVSLAFPGGEPMVWHKIYRPGDVLTIYRGNTIAVKGMVKVEQARYHEDSKGVTLTLSGDTALLEAGDHLENHDAAPEITIRRCRTGRNRPRGFLLSSWKKTVVEDCHFYNCASAIDFTGDTTYWHESGPVGDVTIRRNVFENCGYCGDNGTITANPHFEACEEEPCYHKNITVEDNLFICFSDSALIMNDCDGITYRGNRYVRSMAYPRRESAPRVVLNNCLNVQIEE